MQFPRDLQHADRRFSLHSARGMHLARLVATRRGVKIRPVTRGRVARRPLWRNEIIYYQYFSPACFRVVICFAPLRQLSKGRLFRASFRWVSYVPTIVSLSFSLSSLSFVVVDEPLLFHQRGRLLRLLSQRRVLDWRTESVRQVEAARLRRTDERGRFDCRKREIRR